MDLKPLKLIDGGFKRVDGRFEGSLSPLRDQNGHVVGLNVENLKLLNLFKLLFEDFKTAKWWI